MIIRKTILLLGCLLFSCLTWANAQRTGATVILFELSDRGHIFLRVRVNNSEPLWFILDSGSGDTVLNNKLIKKLKLKVVAGGNASGAGGEQAAVLTDNVALDINGVRLAHQEIPAIDFERLEKSIGREISGMLGYDFIRRFVLEVDYQALVMRVHNAASYRYRGTGEVLPITTEADHPHVRLTVGLPGREPLTGKFVIDGGAGGVTLEFSSSFVAAHQLLERMEILETKTLAAIGGTHTISYGRGETIQIGKLLLQKPILGFSTASRGSLVNPKIAGLIGTKLLRRFTVIYDDKRHRIIFEPNRSFADPD
jgi:hypothetical protein